MKIDFGVIFRYFTIFLRKFENHTIIAWNYITNQNEIKNCRKSRHFCFNFFLLILNHRKTGWKILRNITKIWTKTAENQWRRGAGGRKGVPKLPKIHEFLIHLFWNLEPLEKKGNKCWEIFKNGNKNCQKSGRGGGGGSNTHLIIDQKTEIAHIICPNWGKFSFRAADSSFFIGLIVNMGGEDWIKSNKCSILEARIKRKNHFSEARSAFL